jgi:bacterioferritin-associated ferredoxin
MYVCICKGVTERQIEAEIRNGATSMRDLSQRLGVATRCGACGRCARAMLMEQRCITESKEGDELAFAPA